MRNQHSIYLTPVVLCIVKVTQKIKTRIDHYPFALPLDEIAPSAP